MENYKNEQLGAWQRATDLVERMTLEERASQLRYDAPAIPSLGVPAYNWWNEALHGVARAGVATVFPQAIGLAAMFDAPMMKRIAQVIATEGRAKYNAASRQGDRDIYKGLTFWSPNINIFRDPRWGRGHETYGEDPYLTGQLGVAFIKGLQEGEGHQMKAAACAKHFAVHSGPENVRHEFDAEVSQKDLFETYLPAFEAAVVKGQVEAIMGSYNRVNGEPACGSPTLLQKILREKWGFAGHVVSDCWAIQDFWEFHKVAKNAQEAAAMAIAAGCDINCGVTYLHLLAAHEQGLVTQEQITRAATRAMATRIRLGLFDAHTVYDDIGYEEVDAPKHKQMAREAAVRSAVLLKNDGLLPIDPKKLSSIAVIGPNADSRIALIGNYEGTASEYVTLVQGIREALDDNTRLYAAQGCHLFNPNTAALAQGGDRIAEAVQVASMADVVVLCVGLDSTIEGEQGDAGNAAAAGDKIDLELPQPQRDLVKAVLDVGKPTVVVLAAGSAIALNMEQERASAIINMWYPGGEGGRALADILFGKENPSGRLPVTFYRTVADLPPYEDYAMKGRTYRFFEGEPLYPFGYGLSYTKFAYDKLAVAQLARDEDVQIAVNVRNEGARSGSEVVQVYVKALDSDLAVLNHELCAFARVELAPGEEKSVELTLPASAFTTVDEKGERIYAATRFLLYVGGSQPDARSVALMGKEPLCCEVSL